MFFWLSAVGGVAVSGQQRGFSVTIRRALEYSKLGTIVTNLPLYRLPKVSGANAPRADTLFTRRSNLRLQKSLRVSGQWHLGHPSRT